MAAPIRAKSDAFVAIPGYREWVRDLKGVSRDLERAVRLENKAVADEVAEAAVAAAKAVSPKYAKAAPGIRARGRSTAAAVAMMVNKYPWILGAEFGARQYAQFPAWTGNQWVEGDGPEPGTGYALYPTIRRMVPDIVVDYADRVEARIAQVWTGGRPAILDAFGSAA